MDFQKKMMEELIRNYSSFKMQAGLGFHIHVSSIQFQYLHQEKSES